LVVDWLLVCPVEFCVVVVDWLVQPCELGAVVVVVVDVPGAGGGGGFAFVVVVVALPFVFTEVLVED
jgi:hypothetical protein